jgi:hypothetical protein
VDSAHSHYISHLDVGDTINIQEDARKIPNKYEIVDMKIHGKRIQVTLELIS